MITSCVFLGLSVQSPLQLSHLCPLKERLKLLGLNIRLPPPLQVEAYDADELNFHGGLRVSFGMQLMAATARIEAEIPSIKWPFLLLHGDADKLCDLRGSTMMYENTPSSDKKIKVGWASSGCGFCVVVFLIL